MLSPPASQCWKIAFTIQSKLRRENANKCLKGNKSELLVSNVLNFFLMTEGDLKFRIRYLQWLLYRARSFVCCVKSSYKASKEVQAFWHKKQTISPYTTTIVDTLFQISNHPQSLEQNSMHWIPIINTYHLLSTCLRSLASIWIGLWTLFFSAAKPAVTTLWIKWSPKQANPAKGCCWTPSSYLQHNS